MSLQPNYRRYLCIIIGARLEEEITLIMFSMVFIVIVMQLSLIMDETWSKNVEPLYYMIGI